VLRSSLSPPAAAAAAVGSAVKRRRVPRSSELSFRSPRRRDLSSVVPPGAAGAAKAAPLSIAAHSPQALKLPRDVNLSSPVEKVAPGGCAERGGLAGSAEEEAAPPGCSIRSGEARGLA